MECRQEFHRVINDRKVNDKRFKCNKCGKPHYIRIQHVYDGDYPDMRNTKLIITETEEKTESDS